MSESTTSKPARQSRFASALDAFRWLRLPGMDVKPLEAPQPLLTRCQCGKVISHGRVCCRQCGLDELRAIALDIQTPDDLNHFLEQFDKSRPGQIEPSERMAVLTSIQPFLRIGPNPEATSNPEATEAQQEN